ncbi:MAG: helix-turn-helix domain-containing protein [Porticoccaceae bacterium]
METIKFELHDMATMMTAILCFLFATMIVASGKFRPISACLLAGFFLSQSFISLHELILYGDQFRYAVLSSSPNWFFIGSLGYALNGPLLYLYVISIIRSDFTLGSRHRWHLLPLVVYFLFLIFAFYSQTHMQKVALIDLYQFDLDWQFVTMDTLIKSSRFAYFIMSIYLINKYREQLKDYQSSIENIDLTWLKILVLGFALVSLVGVLLSISKVVNLFYTVDISLQIFLGLTTYYADLILVCFLLFFSAANISSVAKVKDQSKSSYEDYEANEEYVDRVIKFMDDEKPYLKSNITLDTLSELIDVPARELTALLNGHFKMNYYEFINNYRIKEAKLILAQDVNQEKTISDVFLAVGFNSKSVFNTFFKKNVGVTPTDFRKQILNRES